MINGTPTQAEAQASPYTVNVTATDPDGLSVSNSFQLTIGGTNDQPTLVSPIGNQSADEDALFSLNVSGNFSDPDGDNLTFTASGLPASLRPISAAGLINGTPTQAEAEANGGVYNINVTATDPDGLSVSNAFQLTIGGTNDAPIVVTPISNQTASEGAPYSLDVLGTFSDPDGDSLTFSATGLPASLDPIDPVDGIIFGNPTQAEAEANGGVYNVTVTATDPSNADCKQFIHIDH